MNPMLMGIVVLSVLLAVSSAGNFYQYRQALEDATRYGTTKQLAEDTKAAAGACTKSVDDLAKKGDARARRLEDALKAVAPTVSRNQAEAIAALRAQPDDLKDLCGSLGRYWKREIEAEKGAK